MYMGKTTIAYSYIDFLNSLEHGRRIGVTQGRDEDASTMTPKKKSSTLQSPYFLCKFYKDKFGLINICLSMNKFGAPLKS